MAGKKRSHSELDEKPRKEMIKKRKEKEEEEEEEEEDDSPEEEEEEDSPEEDGEDDDEEEDSPEEDEKDDEEDEEDDDDEDEEEDSPEEDEKDEEEEEEDDDKEEEEEDDDDDKEDDDDEEKEKEDKKKQKKEDKKKQKKDKEKQKDDAKGKKDRKKERKEVSEGEEEPKPKKQKTDLPKGPGEKEKRTVFVGQLPRSVAEKELMRYFSGCGVVEKINVLTFQDSGKGMGAAFIEFKHEVSAEKAIERNGSKWPISGKPIKVTASFSKPGKSTKGSKKVDAKTIYVGNLNFHTGPERIRALFSTCGPIIDIRIPRFRDSNRRRGFAMVEYEHTTSLEKAMQLNGSKVQGREITVQRVADNRGTLEPKQIPAIPEAQQRMREIYMMKKKTTTFPSK